MICFFDEDLCVDMKDFNFGAIVGRGSFATVHRGTWRGIEVALKQIRMPCGSGATTTNLPKSNLNEKPQECTHYARHGAT